MDTPVSNTILSFDVGIKNLSFCLLKKRIGVFPIEVLDWDVIDLSQNGNVDIKDSESVVASLLMALESRFDTSSVHLDYVVIENQPAQKNPSMKTIQVALFTYFVMRKCKGGSSEGDNGKSVVSRKPTIRLYSATNKLKPSSLLTKTELDTLSKEPVCANATAKYAHRKKLSVEAAKYLVEQKRDVLVMGEDVGLCDRFQQSKKKDDMADSLLQAIHFVSSCAAL